MEVKQLQLYSILPLDTSDYVKLIYRQTFTQQNFSVNKTSYYLNPSVFTTLDMQPLHLVISVTPSTQKFKYVSIVLYLFPSMNFTTFHISSPVICFGIPLQRELIFFAAFLFRNSNCARIWQFLTWADSST